MVHTITNGHYAMLEDGNPLRGPAADTETETDLASIPSYKGNGNLSNNGKEFSVYRLKRGSLSFECYDLDEILAQLPVNAELLYNVEVVPYGFLHDVGFRVVFSPNHDGYGRGWDTLKEKFNSALLHVRECWEIAAHYGYH